MKILFKIIRLGLMISIAPTVIVIGILQHNQFREYLTDANVQKLIIKTEVLTNTIVSSDQISSSPISQQSDKSLLDLDRLRPLLNPLITSSEVQVRVYDKDGHLIINSDVSDDQPNNLKFNIGQSSNVIRKEIIKPKEKVFFTRLINKISNRAVYEDLGDANGNSYPEVQSALNGYMAAIVRNGMTDETVITVAYPLKKSNAIQGALLLTDKRSDVDGFIENSVTKILNMYILSIIVSMIISAYIIKSKQ